MLGSDHPGKPLRINFVEFDLNFVASSLVVLDRIIFRHLFSPGNRNLCFPLAAIDFLKIYSPPRVVAAEFVKKDVPVLTPFFFCPSHLFSAECTTQSPGNESTVLLISLWLGWGQRAHVACGWQETIDVVVRGCVLA